MPTDAKDAAAQDTAPAPVHVDHLINDGELAAENAWCVSYDDEALPEQLPAFVPLALWREHLGDTDLAPLLTSDTELTPALGEELKKAHAVAIDFPAFTDGRGYSLARLLRERYGFTGELRAVGDVLIDQLNYMERCGFNAMALRQDQDPETALRALSAFSVRYQTDVQTRSALFERRLAAAE
ncbi:DUF934 domain-containing protein [Halomonas sp. GD1P12]|uniref:DUF934 domain-containing protein n=1 Tax=Halomonas sp. GD1P12 TaxID=2982691 RepID=UPI0021E4A0CD|nr:DUF934 domain-containing protein [Halomonas sp. GD1P12]UYF98384.1 DUF934 domain-containing protein [Halomonas sp. GD1P12]